MIDDDLTKPFSLRQQQVRSEEAGALGLTGAREQGVILRFNLDPTCDLVLADRVQIQQVLVNLFPR